MKKHIIGSILFSILMPIYTLLFAVFASVILVCNKNSGPWIIKLWSRHILKLLEISCDLKVEIIGKIPEHAIIASQHQSMLEIIALCFYVPNCIFIFKHSLARIPFVGFILKTLEMIPVNRKKFNTHWSHNAEQILIKKKNLIIFPEGTRVAYAQQTEYKKGVFKIAKKMNMKIVPVAINCGLFWPRKGWIKTSGTAKIIFGEPMRHNAKTLRKAYANLISQA